MANGFHEFDQIFRDRLKDQTATPPDSVWNNIQAERTYGHIIANKISSSWRMIGTLLLLAMAGGTSALLMSQEDEGIIQANIDSNTVKQIIQEEPNTTIEKQLPTVYSFTKPTISNQRTNPQYFSNKALIDNEVDINVESDLLASRSDIGFGKPNFGDSRLSVLIDEMNGWGSAKPTSIVRYYTLSGLAKKDFDGVKMVKSPMIPEEKWDYVIESAPKKTFKERLAAHIYIGPQFINKMLTPKYNMETAFLKERLKTENTRLAYTMGVNFQYELKKNKFFETGIQFTQIYEEVRINGDMRFSNQYDFLEIPFLIGYQDRESKWGWSVKGGLGIQVYNNYKGYILKNVESRITAPVSTSPESTSLYRISGSNVVKNIVNNDHSLSSKQDRNEVYDLSSDENPYKNNGIVNVHFAAGVTYYHSIKTSFSLTPYYRQSVNSITKQSADFNERISYMGILFGTRVNF